MEEITVKPGMFVKYSYTLKDANDGAVLFETPKGEPDEMVFGVSQEVIPGLVSTLEGLKKGDKFEVTLPPAAAFGERREENVLELDKEIFMRDGEFAEEVKAGAELPMMTAEGFRILGKVIEVGKKVKMDFNHPFAGLTVTFNGEVEEVREATAEELHPTKGCGCGCGSHNSCGEGCGCGDGDSHGDGCGCGEGGGCCH